MFTRENTKQIKGIAILLMLAHHLFFFPERIPTGYSLSTGITLMGYELTQLIGQFGKICVPIFMFLGGYGLYLSFSPNSLTRRLVRLYKSYWKIFFLFIPIGILFFRTNVVYCESESLCRTFADFSVKKILSDLTGFHCYFNAEWWFFRAYIIALILGFVYIELFQKCHSFYIEFGFLLLLQFTIFTCSPDLTSILTSEYEHLFLIGIVFAKYNIFDIWHKLTDSYTNGEKIAASIVFLIIFACLWVGVFSSSFHMVLIPLFVFACRTLLNAVKFLNRPLELLGEHSTNMWLIHTFYCYYFYPIVLIVYGSQIAIVAYIILLFMTLASSYLVNIFWKLVGKLYGKVVHR
ncbi:MAG: acyltransferase family protein [Lachnospiraceae bacterium]